MKTKSKQLPADSITTISDCESVVKSFSIEKNAEYSALSLSDYPAEIQSVLSFLVANKTPVTLVFNITNNNMQIGDSQASNICLITGHDNSSISGHENEIIK
jgi:hypothetical protein